MVGGDDTLKPFIFRAMLRAGELSGEIHLVTETNSDKMVAVAIGFPPGKSLFDT